MYHLFPSYQLKTVIACVFMRKDGPGSEKHYTAIFRRYLLLKHIPLCRTAAGQREFTFRGQRLWNSLPDEFQSITNLAVFKVKIKQHFLRVFLENYKF